MDVHIEYVVWLYVQIDFEQAAHCEDWVLGTHGITIDFDVNSKSYSGMYVIV